MSVTDKIKTEINKDKRKISLSMKTLEEKEAKEVLKKYKKDNEEIWSSITTNQGSVSHLEFLTNYEKSSPATNLKRLRQMHSKLGRLIKGKQRNAVMSKKVANIINSFKESGVNYKGIDGIWDAVEKRVLNANEEPDRERLWSEHGRRGMGFRSVTDTRGGPNEDLDLIAKQLTEIDEGGVVPALGFDSTHGGSLEAVDITFGTPAEVLSKTSPNQESIGYLDEDGKFTIEYNDRYLGKK